MKSSIIRFVTMMLLVVIGTVRPAAQAATRNWNGATTGSWSTAANWMESAVPSTNDDVVIADSSAVVVLSTSTFPLASIRVGGTLIFTNWDTTLTAVDVTVTNGGAITHYFNTATNPPWTPNNRVLIACSNLTVQAGGAIDADAKGYRNGGFGKASYGPGAGPYGSGYAAGHGGGGGIVVMDNQNIFSSGQVYGDTFNPTSPGSAGGSHLSSGLGGDGGGAIAITATGEVRVDGIVSANSGAIVPVYASGGSGGSVLIVCHIFTGSGAVRTRGGVGREATYVPGAGGGGGRIAIRYSAAQSNLVAQPLVMLDASGGNSPKYAYAGDLGTIWLPDTLLLRDSLTNMNGQIFGFNAWSPDRIACTNNRVRFVEDGFHLRVTNDILVSDAAGGLEIGRARFVGNRFYSIASNALVNVEIGGELILTNGGSLSVFSAATNTAPDYGALLSVTGPVGVYSNSVLSLYSDITNGGSVLVRAAGVQVAAFGKVDADGKGYGNLGIIQAGTNYGVGPGFVLNNSGGCHGGGGSWASATATQTNFPDDVLTQTYGSITNPVTAGSTGGRHTSTTHPRIGNNGGGVVRIETTGHVEVAGSISANGSDAVGSYDGAGAGGSVNIRCRTIAGEGGVVRANGGWNTGNQFGGGGGGGRVAVLYEAVNQAALAVPDIAFSAMAGCHGAGTYQNYVGDVGTLYFPDNRFLTSPLKHSGEWHSGAAASWAVDALLVSNQWFRFPAPGFVLTVTNDLIVTGSTNNLPLWHRLELSNGWVNCGSLEVRHGRLSLMRTEAGGSRLSCAGQATIDAGVVSVVSGGTGVVVECANLLLTNKSWLVAEGAATNPAVADHGGRVVIPGVVEVGAGSWIRPLSHGLNGGSVQFDLKELRIASGGGFDASAAGYRERGNFNTNYGTGPGRGLDYGGGGYGGEGGTPGSGAAGGSYGLTNAPIHSGSAGGKRTTFWRPYNWGGGAVRIRADQVTLNGTIRADGGATGGTDYGGGGSGGSILLWCKTFNGASGTLNVKGGNVAGGAGGAGGGAGRIALWLGGITDGDAQNLLAGLPVAGTASTTNWSGLVGTVDLAGGVAITTPTRDGKPGSFVALSKPLPTRGTLLMVR